MAIVSRQEFADMCGDDVKILNVYISRKKVIATKEGIDTKNPINVAYVKKRKQSNAVKKETVEVIKRVPPAKMQPKAKSLGDEDDSEDNPDVPYTPETIAAMKSGRVANPDDHLSAAEYMFMQLKGNAELAITRAEKEAFQLEKAKGRLLPIDLVTDIHKRYASNIFNHFENGVENMAVKFCQMVAAGDMEKYTAFLEACRHELKRCIAEAGAETAEDIERLIEEFSDNRGRGEKKV